MNNRPITPHLWFDTEAIEAANFYVSLFENSRVTHTSSMPNTPTPSGNTDIVSFELDGQPFMAIAAGPVFKLNPSISFLLNFDPARWSDAEERLNAAWEKLSDGGKVLMPLDTYPYSKRYGWVQDKYGVSWQLMLTRPEGEPRPFITPMIMFTQEGSGRADEAIAFYTSVFEDGKRGTTAKRDDNTLMYAEFFVHNTWFATMDGGNTHDFTFNEAVSFVILCDTQEEIDYYWEKLSAVPKSEQCGWLKDQFGVSWQVCPTLMGTMMSTGTPEQLARVTKAFMPMKKFDIAALQKAFDGE